MKGASIVLLFLLAVSVHAQDSLHVRQVGQIPMLGSAYGVAVAGNYAYVANGWSGLRVISISDPAHPMEVGFYVTPDEAWDVAVAGNYAYVVCSFQGLRVISISDPVNPVEVGFCDTPGYELRVAVAGAYIYVAGGGSGLRVISISDPVNPAEVGSYGTLAYARGVAVSGNYAYVADDYRGLRVISISDPVHPAEVGFYDTVDPVWGVAVAGSYAYVAGGVVGLRVISISDPVNPTEVGSYDTPGWAWGVAVLGDYAYVADRMGGLRVISISDPTHPSQVGFYRNTNTLDYARGVAVSGNYAYVTRDTYFDIYDCSEATYEILYEIHVDQVTLNGSSSYDFNTGLIAGNHLDIVGHVTNTGGQRVPNLAIRIIDDLSSVCSEVHTNANGDFTYSLTVQEGLNEFHHQVTFFRPNTWPVYLAVPLDVRNESHLLRQPRLNFLLDELNADMPIQFDNLTSQDDNGNWLWTSPYYFQPGVKGIHSAADVNENNYWEVLKIKYFYSEGTDPFLGHPEIYERAEEVAAGTNRATTRSRVDQLETTFHFAQQNVVTILFAMGAWTICASAVVDAGASSPFCVLAVQTTEGLAALYAADLMLATAGVDEQDRDILETASSVSIALNNPVRFHRYAESALIGSDMAVASHSIQPQKNVLGAACQGQPFTNGTVLDEWESNEHLDDLRWHNWSIQFDWGDTTYQVEIMAKYDPEAVRSRTSIPTGFSLSSFPNPFNPSTTLSFSLPREARARIAVFDVLGREVAVLADDVFTAGEHRIMFDGSSLPSGIYFARLQSGSMQATHKLLLMK